MGAWLHKLCSVHSGRHYSLAESPELVSETHAAWKKPVSRYLLHGHIGRTLLKWQNDRNGEPSDGQGYGGKTPRGDQALDVHSPAVASYHLGKDVATGERGKGHVGSRCIFSCNCVLFCNFKRKSLIKNFIDRMDSKS